MPNPARTRHPLTIFLKSAGKGFRDMLKPSFRREKRTKGKKEGWGADNFYNSFHVTSIPLQWLICYVILLILNLLGGRKYKIYNMIDSYTACGLDFSYPLQFT